MLDEWERTVATVARGFGDVGVGGYARAQLVPKPRFRTGEKFVAQRGSCPAHRMQAETNVRFGIGIANEEPAIGDLALE